MALACVEYADATETWYLNPLVQLGAIQKNSFWRGVKIYDTHTGALVGALKTIKSEQDDRSGSRASCFSPDGTSLAASLERHKLNIYDFPLRKPWTWIAVATLVGAITAFLVVRAARIVLRGSRRLVARLKKQRSGLPGVA